MARREPDARYHAALHARECPEHQIEGALWQAAHQVGSPSEAVLRAAEIYEDVFEREMLQAWVVAGAPDNEIERRLLVMSETVKAFRHLCFDVSVFRDRLELLRWVRQYTGSDDGRLYLQTAVLHGVEPLAWLCGLDANVDPQRVMQGVMSDSFFRGLAHRNASVASKEASAAHAFQKTALSTAQALMRRGPPDIGSLIIKLKHRDLTAPVENEVREGAILH